MRVEPIIPMRAELSFQFGQELIERVFFRGQQLEQSQAGKDTVALRDVSRETDAAALLEAHQHVALLHLGADVFEADTGLEQFQPMRLTDAIDHRGGRQRLDHAATLASIDDVVMKQQANDLVGCQRVAAAVHSPDAVRVTVCHEAEIVRVPAQIRGTRAIVVNDRLGVDAAKKRVMLRVERGDFALGPAEDLFKRPGADAEQGIMCEAQPGVGDQVEVHELPNRPSVRRMQVLDANQTPALGQAQVERLHRLGIEQRLNCLAGLGRG